MAQKAPPVALPGFSSLGLDDRLVKTLAELGYEEPTPIQREAIPPLLEGQGPGGPGGDGHGQDGGLCPADACTGCHRGARRRTAAARWRWSSCRPANWRCRWPKRSTATAGRWRCKRAADLRRPGVRARSCGPRAGHRRRGRHAGPGARPHPPRDAEARRRGRRRPGRGRRDARHGVRRGHRVDPRRDARASRQTLLFSATLPPRIAGDRPPPPERPGADQDRRGARRGGRIGAEVRQTAYIVPREHKLAALGRVLDVEGSDLGDRLLPPPHRGRRAGRERSPGEATAPRPARRDDPGAAQPRDEAVPRRRRRTC